MTAVVEAAVSAAGAGEASSSSAPVESTAVADPPTASTAADEPAPASPTAAETPAPEAKAADTDPDEAEIKAIEAELTKKTPTLKQGKIDVARHQAVLTRARRQAEAALETERRKYLSYQTAEFQDNLRGIQLAQSDPQRFAELLLSLPHYREIFESRLTKKEQAALAKEDPMPEEELLSDGTVGYSPEGMKKLLEWKTRQLEKTFEQRQAEQLKQLEPILQQHRAQQERVAAEQRVLPMLEEARRRWEGFTEHEQEIAAVMHEDAARAKAEGRLPTMTLGEAYDAVVPAKQALKKASLESEIESRLVAKLNSKSTLGSAPAPGAVPAATAAFKGERSMEDVVRDAIRSAAPA